KPGETRRRRRRAPRAPAPVERSSPRSGPIRPRNRAAARTSSSGPRLADPGSPLRTDRPAAGPAPGGAASTRPRPSPTPWGPLSGASPGNGTISSRFGSRWGSFHEGVDIANDIGTPVRAGSSGTVISSGPASGYGLWVRVEHADSTISIYGHIDSSNVRVGQ